MLSVLCQTLQEVDQITPEEVAECVETYEEIKKEFTEFLEDVAFTKSALQEQEVRNKSSNFQGFLLLFFRSNNKTRNIGKTKNYSYLHF